MSSASASRRDGLITDINAGRSEFSKINSQPTGGIASSDIPNITALVNSLQADIKHIKTQLQNLPPFPQGQRPPSPLARFQNNVERIEGDLKSKNQKEKDEFTLPRITSTPKKIDPSELNRPLKKILNEQKYNYLTSDPENHVGHDLIRQKFGLPQPNKFKYGRHQGGISNIELEKLGIGARQAGNIAKPKRILPKAFRDDPFADPPPITENDIRDGMFSLLTRGVIPKDVDLTPAFERGNAPLQAKQAVITELPPQLPKQLTQKPSSPTKRMLAQMQALQQVTQSQASDQSTFLTAVQGDVNEHMIKMDRKQQKPQRQEVPRKQPVRQDRNSSPEGNGFEKIQTILENDHQNELALVPMEQSDIQPASSTFGTFQQIILRQGKIDESTSEYTSFKRQNITRWGGLTYLIQQIERLISQYQVQFCYLNVSRMLELQDLELDKYSQDDLLSCVINLQTVLDAMHNPKVMFKGPNGPVLATIKIQTAWRRYKAYNSFSQLKHLMIMATMIQRKYRLYQLKKSTKLKIQKLKQESFKVWNEMQDEFKQCWPHIKKGRRVEIHINSFNISELRRLSLEKYKQRENAQIARIFRLKDPNVDVIYVAPFMLTSEVTKYYMKILELVEIENAAGRLHIVIPENYVKFKGHMSLTTALMYSPKACKQIQNLIADKQAYIVPGKYSEQDVRLSIQLGVPILCGDPSKTSMLASKSCSKRIFQQCDIPISVSAYDIYERKEFEQALSRLIANNLDVNVWIFKLDDEFGGRGHASLDVEQVRTVVELRRKKVEMTEAVIQRLQEVITKILPRKAKIAQPGLYKNWDMYMAEFQKCGGVIEAAPPLCQLNQLQSPTVSFLIEPDGQVELVGSYDKFSGAEFINAGAFSPQTSLPSIDLLKICESVGSVLYAKGAFGHVSVDLISFPNVENPDSHPFFWAVDLSLELTDNAAISYFFDILMEGNLDQQTGEYNVTWEREVEDIQQPDSEQEAQSPGTKVQDKDAVARNQPGSAVRTTTTTEPRGFMFCNFLHHPGFGRIQYKTLFHMCRLESISFDMENRSGSTFCLYDTLPSAVIGMLTIGVHRQAAVQFMQDAITFIQNQVGQLPQKAQGEFQGQDQIALVDIAQRVKIISRVFDNANRTQTQTLKEGDKVKPPQTFNQATL